ncbi:MAG: glycerate kinase [Saprospiraceae bacterium]|nr:glycerate kinase [Saprospiraceae bacterium]
MKVIIAPDSFKGSLTALEVAKSIEKGIKKVDANIETVIVPMADGGEGTVQSLIDASEGVMVAAKVHDPLLRPFKSFYGIMGDGKTAVIEMAAASGLELLKNDERNALKTSTFGTGELIKHAIDRGCTEIIIGLGGSATNDGGTGMAQALGVRFRDKKGKEQNMCGAELINIHTVDMSGLDARVKGINIIAACDVDNPLYGIKGSSNVYGRQKGASETDVQTLDKGLKHFSEIMKFGYGFDFSDYPGAGAAGGLGYGLMCFLGATLASGIETVMRATKFTKKIAGADFVFTGEGRIDSQTAFGKTPFGVAQVAKQTNIPVIAIAGSLGNGYKELYNKGFDGIFSIIDKPMTLTDALVNAEELVENMAESIMRLILLKQIKH